MVQAKRRILFVDDDPAVLNTIRKAEQKYSDQWESIFASSVREALVLLSQLQIDVVVTDLRMPGTDGAALLEQIYQRFPDVIRILMAENTEISTAFRATQLAHQFVTKPMDIDQLWELIERSSQLRLMLTNPQLLKMITGIRKLPSLPNLYSKLVKELNSSDPEPKIVADIISQDVAMTAKILQIVNSAYYGLPGQVSSVHRAVTLIGINTTRALVLGIQIFGEFQRSMAPFFSIDALWQHSLAVSQVSRVIAKELKLDMISQENAQIIGLLHDIGKLLQVLVPEYLNLYSYEGEISTQAEYQVFGTSHAEMGAYLLSLWGLPQQVVETVAYHHCPSQQVSSKNEVLAVVHIANGLCYPAAAPGLPTAFPRIDQDFVQKHGLEGLIDGWYNANKAFIKGSQPAF